MLIVPHVNLVFVVARWVNNFELIAFVPQKGTPKKPLLFQQKHKTRFLIFEFCEYEYDNQIYPKVDIPTTDRVIDNLSTIIYSLFTLKLNQNDLNLFYVSTLLEIWF